jgi:hypothetical protein
VVSSLFEVVFVLLPWNGNGGSRLGSYLMVIAALRKGKLDI